MAKIHVRFDNAADKHRELGHFDMKQVPSRGDLVNIDGEPYTVVALAWAVVTRNPTTFAYVGVIPYKK